MTDLATISFEQKAKLDLNTLRKLVKQNPEAIKQSDSHGNSLLHRAVLDNKPQSVETLLMCSMDINSTNQDGETALMTAARTNKSACLKKLCSFQANPDVATPDQRLTALHWAAICRNAKSSREILRLGGNLLALDQDGNTPLHHACMSQSVSVCRVLLEKNDKTQVSTRNLKGQTPLDLAKGKVKQELLKILESTDVSNRDISKNSKSHVTSKTQWSFSVEPSVFNCVPDAANTTLEQAYRTWKDSGKPQKGALARLMVPFEGSMWEVSLSNRTATECGLAGRTFTIRRDRIRIEKSASDLEIPKLDVKIANKLAKASGCGGMLFIGEMKDLSDMKRSVKVAVRAPQSNQDNNQLLKEAHLLRELSRCPYILDCFGTVDWHGTLCAVTELAQCSLQNLLMRAKKSLDPMSARAILLDSSRGLEFLCDHGVVHKNVSAESILVFQCPRRGIRSKIGGLHRSAQSSDSLQRKAAFLAPEVIASKENYTTASDVYAFAMVMWAVAHWRLPFQGKKPFQIMQSVSQLESRPDIDDTIDLQFRAIFEDAWSQAPSDRIDFAEISSRLDLVEAVPRFSLTPASSCKIFNGNLHLVENAGSLHQVNLNSSEKTLLPIAAGAEEGAQQWELADQAEACFSVGSKTTKISMFDPQTSKSTSECTVPFRIHKLKPTSRSRAWYQDAEGRVGTLDIALGDSKPLTQAVLEGTSLCGLDDGRCMLVTPQDARICSAVGKEDVIETSLQSGPSHFANQSSCGRYVATLHSNGCMVWDTLNMSSRWIPTEDAPAACCFLPSEVGRLAIAVGTSIQLFPVTGGAKKLRSLDHTSEKITALCCANEGHLCAVDERGETQVWHSLQ